MPRSPPLAHKVPIMQANESISQTVVNIRRESLRPQTWQYCPLRDLAEDSFIVQCYVTLK